MFSISWPEGYEVVIFIVTCGVVMLKIGYSEKCQGLRWLFCVISGIVFGLSWWNTEYNYLFLLYIPVLIAGAIDVDYKKILRVSFWINFTTLVLAFIGSCAGVIPDLSYEAEVGHRHSFGIMYTTDFAARVFYLLVAGWVLFDGLHIIISLLTTAICTWFIYYYCQGKCSAITLTLFMAAIVYEYVTRNDRLMKKLPVQIIDYIIAWFAPIGAGVILYMSLSYKTGVEWIYKADEILTRRLMFASDAIDKYGFTFLGTAFEQRGAGGTTAYNFFYNFIDSSYVLVLLRYGSIVFTILMILAVYQSRIALKTEQRKLLCAIMLVSVHSIVEHHMPEVNYNIFLILPFAAIRPLEVQNTGTVKTKNVNWKAIIALIAALAAALLTMPVIMRYIATLAHLLKYNEPDNNIYFIFESLLIAAIVSYLVYMIIKIFICRPDVKIGFKDKVRLAISIIIMAVIVINSKKILQEGMIEYADTYKYEKDIIEQVLNTCGEDIRLYIEDLPGLYKNGIPEVSDKVMPIETCDMTKDDSIIIVPIKRELSSLLQSGYYFGKLSDVHGVYTNNKKAISILRSNGVVMTDYYSVLSEIDMKAMADANELDMTDKGALILSGNEKAIYHGPWIALGRGRYIIEFDVQLICTNGNEIGMSRVTSDSGKTWLDGKYITMDDFDENGHGIIRFDIGFWCDSYNTEFILITNEGTDLMVNSIGYCKVSSIEDKEQTKDNVP